MGSSWSGVCSDWDAFNTGLSDCGLLWVGAEALCSFNFVDAELLIAEVVLEALVRSALFGQGLLGRHWLAVGGDPSSH